MEHTAMSLLFYLGDIRSAPNSTMQRSLTVVRSQEDRVKNPTHQILQIFQCQVHVGVAYKVGESAQRMLRRLWVVRRMALLPRARPAKLKVSLLVLVVGADAEGLDQAAC